MKKALGALVALVALTGAEASQTRWFSVDTPRALAGAIGHGMAVFPDGSLRPLPPLAEVAKFDEPLGLALAVAPDGTAYVGTGHPARIWRVKDNTKELVGEVASDQITSLLLAPGGDLYATTALPALVVRLARHGAKLETVATLKDGNVWDLAWFKGALVAAAGNPGRLLRLGPKGLEKVLDIPDTHARCLAVAGPNLLIGTSGKGLVLRWSGDGPLGVLADSSFTEIAALTVAPDGTAYAAVLTGDPTLGKPTKDEGQATVTVSEGGGPSVSAEKRPATSEVLRILPNGAVTTVQRFSKQLAGALDWSSEGLVIGTGLEGELWQVIEGVPAQLDTVDAAQVVRVAGGGSWVLTQSPVKLMARSGSPHGTFTSPALDATLPARWGAVGVDAELPAGATCTIRFRSGAKSEPDDTWSVWTSPLPCAAAHVVAPPARFLQWQLELTGGGETRVDRVQVAYRQVNVAPEIKEFTVYGPGEIFLKQPPPSDRIIEVNHPDRSGIFTTLDDDASERQATLGKRYFRVGYQSLSWKVEDVNGDPLRFDLEVERAGDTAWWKVREDLETTVIAIDTEALPDGLYRFRLTATDEPDNPDAPATATALSPFVTIDNTPPRVTIAREGKEWVVTVDDATSPIALIEWNRDADSWHAAVPEDGMLDSRHEVVRIPVEKGHHTFSVRAADDHHNRAVAAVEEGK